MADIMVGSYDMAAPKLTITKAEIIEEAGIVITTTDGHVARIKARASTLAHGFVFLASDWSEQPWWRQFHVDLRAEPYNLVTGFGDADYRPATSDPIVLEMARQYSAAVTKNIWPPPQQIELDSVRIKLK